MPEIRETQDFRRWFQSLKDARTRGRILARVRRLSLGNEGVSDPLGEGVFELKLHFGPGYRLYYKFMSPSLVVLLLGGDKSSQRKDIEKAKELARGL